MYALRTAAPPVAVATRGTLRTRPLGALHRQPPPTTKEPNMKRTPTTKRNTDVRAILYGYAPRSGTRRQAPYGRVQ
jgi:hypothetical protein